MSDLNMIYMKAAHINDFEMLGNLRDCEFYIRMNEGLLKRWTNYYVEHDIEALQDHEVELQRNEFLKYYGDNYNDMKLHRDYYLAGLKEVEKEINNFEKMYPDHKEKVYQSTRDKLAKLTNTINRFSKEVDRLGEVLRM